MNRFFSSFNLHISPLCIRGAISGLAISIAFCANGCANPSSPIHHGFSFGSAAIDHEVQILDFQYGDEVGLPTRASKEQVRDGGMTQASVVGTFPRGDFLYVRWRQVADGTVHEKRVDLTGISPRDLVDKELHFAFKRAELFVYIIDLKKLHRADAADCPAPAYEILQCSTVYPNKQSNF